MFMIGQRVAFRRRGLWAERHRAFSRSQAVLFLTRLPAAFNLAHGERQKT